MNDKTLMPKYQITVDGEDATATVKDRLMSLSLVDNRGFEADTLQLTVDDSDGKVNLPKTEVKISLKLGFDGQALVDKGDFIVDSVTHSGAPDTITISAKSADFTKKFTEPKNKAYHQKTLKDIIEEIAGDHGWQSQISDDLASIEIEDKQQANESDANFLTRLAHEFDAIATIKKGKLLFLQAGTGKTASGEELTTIEIIRMDGDQHSYTVNDRDAYTGVKALWNKAKHGRRKEILAGDEEKTKRLRTIYKSEEAAQQAAENELKRLKRGAASFTFSLAVGRPDALAESPVKVSGFKKEIDEATWIAVRVTHSINDSGLTTQVEAEVKELS